MEKLFIDKNKCIGCGACEGFDSNIFELGDDGFGFVKKENYSVFNDEEKENADDAIASCPTNAIELQGEEK